MDRPGIEQTLQEIEQLKPPGKGTIERCIRLVPVLACFACAWQWGVLRMILAFVAVDLGTVILAVAFASFFWHHGQCVTPPEHQLPISTNDGIVTLYYPGLGASPMQAARYTGGEPANSALMLPTTIDNAPMLLHRVFACTPPEILFHWQLYQHLAWFYTYLPVMFGIQMQNLVQYKSYLLAWPRTSFAQEDDIAHVLSLYRTLDHDKRIVLAGSSRGASTVLAAVTKMTPAEQARIAFVLVEGGFDSVPGILEARYGRTLTRVGIWFLSAFTRYNPDYPSPLQMAQHFPGKVPIAFVTSEVDWHVPMAHTLRLRDAVKSDKVHTLVLKHSHHSFYVNDHPDDQRAYRMFMEEMHRLYC